MPSDDSDQHDEGADSEVADGSNYRVEDESGSEIADGSNYREDDSDDSEVADGSNYRDQEEQLGSTIADGSNYRDDSRGARALFDRPVDVKRERVAGGRSSPHPGRKRQKRPGHGRTRSLPPCRSDYLEKRPRPK